MTDHSDVHREYTGPVAIPPLSPSQVVVLGLLAESALSPVHGLMDRRTYRSVSQQQALPDGRPFPVPIVLPVAEPRAFPRGETVALRDVQQRLIATLQVDEVFPLEDNAVLPEPEPHERYAVSGQLQFAGRTQTSCLPEFKRELRRVRELLAATGRGYVIAVDEWNEPDAGALHRLQAAARQLNAGVFVNLLDGETQVADFDRYQRISTAEKACSRAFPDGSAVFNVVGFQPAASEEMLLLRAVLHKNFGADAWLLSSSTLRRGGQSLESWQKLATQCESRYGLRMILPEQDEASRHLTEHDPALCRAEGVCIWLTGFSGAGKSSIAERLVIQLMRRQRRVTLLDGDVVRTHLSKGLSFSREDRHTNICRIGYVASEIVSHKGIAVCAAVSPYAADRDAVRCMMPAGAFVEVFVDTPLAVCEARDAKGLYAQARSGSLRAFTGISDAYEAPLAPEIRLCDQHLTPEQQAERIMTFLVQGGYLGAG